MLRGGTSGQEFVLVNSIHWKQEKWIIHVLLLQRETGGKEEEFRVVEIKRGECFKKKTTVNHCHEARIGIDVFMFSKGTQNLNFTLNKNCS